MDNRGRSWAEIDLGAIAANVQAIRRQIGATVQMMAVVKANAYGHGALPVARQALACGADYLGVACLEEALELRGAGIDAPILVLGYVPKQNFKEAIAEQIELTVFDLSSARALSVVAQQTGRTAHIHLKLETGMGRLGFNADAKSVDVLLSIADLAGINIKGLFSHLASADERDKSFARQQLSIFHAFVERLEQRGLFIPVKHIANSAAIMELPEAHLDMVRAGIILYGLLPSEAVDRNILELRPAMRLMSRVIFIKDIAAGTSISYGRSYISPEPRRVATVPIGYADGYSRGFSNRAAAVIRGKRVSLLGKVCMDQCVFDVSELETVEPGDEVILFGGLQDGITAEEMADLIGTIGYEIVCMPSGRIPRCYKS